MKQGWEIKSLGEIGKPSMCKRILKNQTSSTGEIPFYKIGTFGKTPDAFISKKIYDEFRTKYSFPKNGDILISASGTIGRRVRYDGEPAFFQDSNIVWIDNDEKQVLNDYLYVFYEFCEWQPSKGATIARLYNSNLTSIKIAFPKSLSEQQRIVAILDTAFAAIAKAKANAAQNLKNAKELFESYLQGVFETKGEGWEERTLNQISENLDNKRVPITKNVRSEGLIPYYGASGIVDYVADYLFDEDLLCISEDGANLLARTYPIAFPITGKTWVNNHAHVLRFDSMVSQRFVEMYLNSIKLDDWVTGMAQPKLNQSMLNKIPIPFPTLMQQQIIVQKLDALSGETKKLEAIYQQKINDLEELKKSVLQKAFSGELKNYADVTKQFSEVKV